MEEAKGTIKQSVGKAVESTKMQTDGARDKVTGKSKAVAGDVMEKVKEHVKRA